MAIDSHTGDEVSEDEKIRRRLAIKEHREREIKREIIKQARMQPIDTAAGQRQRMAELKEQLLSPGSGKAIVSKVLDIALNDEHPGQMAAMKLCMDRMLPTSFFEEKKDGVRAAIQITIGRVGEENVIKEVVGDEE